MGKDQAEITEAEREVLSALWDGGPGTVREVLDRLGTRWSRSTVITLFQRLEKKGFVATDRSGFAFVFRSLVSRDDLVHRRMTKLADELCGGRAGPLLLSFARKRSFTTAELSELRGLIDDLDRQAAHKLKSGGSGGDETKPRRRGGTG